MSSVIARQYLKIYENALFEIHLWGSLHLKKPLSKSFPCCTTLGNTGKRNCLVKRGYIYDLSPVKKMDFQMSKREIRIKGTHIITNVDWQFLKFATEIVKSSKYVYFETKNKCIYKK